jgi:hypothetical protein
MTTSNKGPVASPTFITKKKLAEKSDPILFLMDNILKNQDLVPTPTFRAPSKVNIKENCQPNSSF